MSTQRSHKKTDDTRSTKPAAKPETKPVAAARPPQAARARAVDPADPQAASPEQLRQMQRQVGNRALNHMLAAGRVQAKLTVGPAGDRYEQEADHMADAVMRSAAVTPSAPDESPEPIQRSPAAPIGLKGGDAGDSIEAKLAANKGGGAPLPAATRAKMETGLGADFSGVRIHTGAESQTLNQALGAQAFTHGADVFMGAGKYAPGSSDGQRLLAHELTHVVQQGAGTVRRAAQPAPEIAPDENGVEGVIRRKLAGTGEAILALGGKASLKSRAKAKGTALKSLVGMNTTTAGSGKYAQIQSGLQAYEKLEAKYASQNRQYLLQKEKSELFGHLKELELLAVAWLAENQDVATSAAQAELNVRNLSPEDIAAQETEDHQRYHALKLLLPRLRHEQMEISRDDFYRTDTWSDKTLNQGASQDDAFGGAVNRLDKVTHFGQEGVFTQEKTWAGALTAGNKLGISAVDPNQGARSVAMYQLAKLLDLGVDVIAKTEFATHTSATNKQNDPLAKPMAKLGVRQEMAEGTEAAKMQTAISAHGATARGGDTISLEDPTLQRSLNAIQLIDAIAGQIDRHWHNYYIATDGHGDVQGVVGIDLDMAFAPDHRTVAPATDAANDPLKGSHFVGLPQLVDSQFAARIVAVQADAVEKLLRNYLTPAEVSAAVDRFTLVKDACRQILLNNTAVMPGGWNVQTAQRQLGAPGASYLASMASGLTKHEFASPAEAKTYTVVKDNEERRHINVALEKLERLIWSKALTAVECLAVVDAIVANYTATDLPGRPALVSTLATTAVPIWNAALLNPGANPGVLARAV